MFIAAFEPNVILHSHDLNENTKQENKNEIN